MHKEKFPFHLTKVLTFIGTSNDFVRLTFTRMRNSSDLQQPTHKMFNKMIEHKNKYYLIKIEEKKMEQEKHLFM